MTVVTHTLLDAFSQPLVGIVVRLQALTNVGTPTMHTGLQASVVAPTELVTNASGVWSVDLVPNASLTPANQYFIQEFVPSLNWRGAIDYTPITWRVTVPTSGGPYQVSAIGVVI